MGVGSVTKVFLKSSPEYLPRLRTIVACLAEGVGMDHQEVEDTKLALTEVCSNAMRYGSPGGIEDTVSVELTALGNTITADVTDNGAEADSKAIVSHLDIGLGMKLIQSLTDTVRFTDRNNGLTVSLTKRAKNASYFESALEEPVGLRRN